MKVVLKLNKDSRGRLLGGSATAIRGSDPKIYNESAFWFAVKTDLQRQGYDVIKKLMWKDGHMYGDDTLPYVRSRKYTPDSFMIYDNDYAVRAVYDNYNRGGETSLAVAPSLEDEAADEMLAKKSSKTKVQIKKRPGSRPQRSSDSGIGRIR